MRRYRATCCALALLVAAITAAGAAEKKSEATKAAPPGRTETLACRLGTEDRHARIAVVVIKGKTDSFAYYSKWKPRTCSIYLQRRGDMFSKWADSGAITTVNLEKGAFLIEHKAGEYHFIFRDIDRERYCGMDGLINGTLTIKRGSDQCVLGGDIMVEGTPLGEAHANVREPEGPLSASPALPDKPPVAAPATAAPAPPSPASAAPAPPPAPQGTSAPTPATAPPPPQKSTAAEPASPPAATPAQPAKPDAAQARAAKPAESQSSSPFGSVFRFLGQQQPPAEQSP